MLLNAWYSKQWYSMWGSRHPWESQSWVRQVTGGWDLPSSNWYCVFLGVSLIQHNDKYYEHTSSWTYYELHLSDSCIDKHRMVWTVLWTPSVHTMNMSWVKHTMSYWGDMHRNGADSPLNPFHTMNMSWVEHTMSYSWVDMHKNSPDSPLNPFHSYTMLNILWVTPSKHA